jgi:hypothetical protein
MASSKAFFPSASVFCVLLWRTIRYRRFVRLILLLQFRFPNVLTNETSKTPRTVGTYLRDKEAQRLRSILENECLPTPWHLGKVLVELSQTIHVDWCRLLKEGLCYPRKYSQIVRSMAAIEWIGSTAA